LHACFFAAAQWNCVAFEPQETCVDYMRRIASLNCFTNLLIERCAVGAQEKADVEFFTSESTWYSSLNRQAVEQLEPAHAMRVRMITLDAYCTSHNLVPDCVKIDVEGGELGVLQGARSLIETAKPDLVIEISGDESDRQEIWEQLTPLGYRAFVLSEAGPDALHLLPDLAAYLRVSSGWHFDAIFTADQELQAWLNARLELSASDRRS
jgi:FkbM family methyltransferase